MRRRNQTMTALFGALLAACFLAQPALAAGTDTGAPGTIPVRSDAWTADAGESAANAQQGEWIGRDAQYYYYQKHDETGWPGATYRAPLDAPSREEMISGSETDRPVRLLALGDGQLYYGFDDEEAMQYRVYSLSVKGGKYKEIGSFSNRQAEVLAPLYYDGSIYVVYFTSEKDAFYPYDWDASRAEDATSIIVRMRAGKETKLVYRGSGRAEQFVAADDGWLYVSIEEKDGEYGMLRVNADSGRMQQVCYAKRDLYNQSIWADPNTGRIDHWCYYSGGLVFALLMDDAREQADLVTIDFSRGASAAVSEPVPEETVMAMLQDAQITGAPGYGVRPLMMRDGYVMTALGDTLYRGDLALVCVDTLPLGTELSDCCVLGDVLCTWNRDGACWQFFTLLDQWTNIEDAFHCESVPVESSEPLTHFLPMEQTNLKDYHGTYKGTPISIGGRQFDDPIMLFVDEFPNDGTMTYIPELGLQAEYAEGSISYRLREEYTLFACSIGCADRPEKFIGPPATHGYSRIRFLSDGECIADTGWFDNTYYETLELYIAETDVLTIEVQQLTGLNDSYYALNLVLADAYLAK